MLQNGTLSIVGECLKKVSAQKHYLFKFKETTNYIAFVRMHNSMQLHCNTIVASDKSRAQTNSDF